MILLDTNVVSEPTKPTPSPAMLASLDAQVFDTLYLTMITSTGSVEHTAAQSGIL